MKLEKRYQKFFIWEGVLLVILGILAILWPNISTLAIEVIVGWLCLVGGVIQAVRYFKMPRGSSSIYSFFIALFYILFGVLILFFPHIGAETLTLLLALLFFAQGIFQILIGLQWKIPGFKIGMCLSGVIALVLSFLIWSKWPLDSEWVIGLLVGINLIFFGISQIFTISKKSNY